MLSPHYIQCLQSYRQNDAGFHEEVDKMALLNLVPLLNIWVPKQGASSWRKLSVALEAQNQSKALTVIVSSYIILSSLFPASTSVTKLKYPDMSNKRKHLLGVGDCVCIRSLWTQLQWPCANAAYFKILASNLAYKLQPLEDFAQSHDRKSTLQLSEIYPFFSSLYFRPCRLTYRIRDLSSPTMDRTHVPCIGEQEVQLLDC